MDWLDWLTGILTGAVVLLALRNPIGREPAPKSELKRRQDPPPHQNL